MSSALSNPSFRDGLLIGKLESIQTELSKYRDFPAVHPSSTKKGAGSVLDFVRGLYFSAKIIYFIREVLSGKPYEVHWGHIIHDAGTYCSPECDIIIHQNGSVAKWNGDVLDFHFVDLMNVVAVISCKSIVASVDEQYCESLLSFGVTSIGLMGEVCSESNFDNLRDKAKKIGYCDLWCLAQTSKEGRRLDENTSRDFIRYLESL